MSSNKLEVIGYMKERNIVKFQMQKNWYKNSKFLVPQREE